MDNNYNYEPAPESVVNESVTRNKSWDMVLTALKDKLFLVLCILTSALAGIGIINGTLPVFPILFTIFLWLVYSKANKGTVDVANLRRISGTTYAFYVVLNVLFISMTVVFVMFAAIMFGARDTFMEALNIAAEQYGGALQAEIIDMFTGTVGVLVVIVLLAISIGGLVINNVGFRQIHRLAKSVYTGIEDPAVDFAKNAHNARKAIVWLWVFGILGAIGALGNLSGASDSVMSFVTTLLDAGTYIVSALLVQKFISVEPEPTQE